MARASSATGKISGTTRVVAVIGNPVEHSLSPCMHNAAFRALGLDYVYVALAPDPKGVGRFLRALGASGLRGLNVTVPFKREALRAVTEASEAARAIGAVNTIVVRRDGSTFGDNTDAGGFAQALRTHGLRLRGKRALVIGAGGAARAVVYQLARSGAAEVIVANRTRSKAVSLARAVTAGKAVACGLEALSDEGLLGRIDVVVNATSVGLRGGRFLDYAPEATREICVHVDLAYSSGATPFLRLAERAGRPAIDGRHMLLHQGALAFRLFTGRKAPLDVMARAIGLD